MNADLIRDAIDRLAGEVHGLRWNLGPGGEFPAAKAGADLLGLLAGAAHLLDAAVDAVEALPVDEEAAAGEAIAEVAPALDSLFGDLAARNGELPGGEA